jgi:hypothetical protein
LEQKARVIRLVQNVEYFPIVLVRGFDPSGQSRTDPFYGFNEGTVYTNTVDQSRIFEGFVVSFLKDPVHGYKDTSNVIRFHTPRTVEAVSDTCFSVSPPEIRSELDFPVDPEQLRRTFWVFRFYDAFPGGIWHRRGFDAVPYFARELQRYIAAVKVLTGAPKVNIVCHSMGGIITRHLIQRRYFFKEISEQNVHRIVSLGTPHGGIRYMAGGFSNLVTGLFGFSEPEAMDPDEINNPVIQVTAKGVDDLPKGNALVNNYGLNGQCVSPSWDTEKWLCVVGTRYDDYQWRVGNIGIGKHSDGLVRQEDAVINCAPEETAFGKSPPRAYLHKTHAGYDSLMTSRESFEVATRFLFGSHWVKLTLDAGSILTRFNNKSQYYIGTSVKPRGVDFFLTQVDRISENTVTLFKPKERSEILDVQGKIARFKENLLLYQGALDLARSVQRNEMVFRIDVVIYAEDEPLLGASPKEASFTMGHNDNRHLDQQIIVRVNINTGELRWYQNSGDAVGVNRIADKVSRADRSLRDGKNVLVYSGLPLKVRQNFDGMLKIVVSER